MSKLVLIIALIASITGCSSIKPDTKTINCLTWVSLNKTDSDVIHYGRFKSSRLETHVWIERNGVCYDNMHQGGFNCDDSRYVRFYVVNANDIDLAVAQRDGGMGV